MLLAIIVGACVKDSTVPESIHKQPQDFCLADARKHYEENIENLCFPEIYLKPIIQTKGSSYFHSLEQTPLWDRFHFSENGWSYIYEIPILYNITLQASIGHITQDGHLIKEDKEVKLQSNLIIQKYKESGNVHVFLSTVVGYISDPHVEIQGDSPWLWTGDRQNFTGYQFFTNPDGSFKGAFQYRNSHRTSITLSVYDKDEEYIYPQEFFSIGLGSIGTKGEGIQEYKKYCWDCGIQVSYEESYCPKCGQGLLDEIPVIPTPDPLLEYCETCKFLKKNCVCGGSGGDVCPYCNRSDCSGECRNIGGDGTGSGGGTTPGGNQNNGPGEMPSDSIITYDNLSLSVIKPIIDKIKEECFSNEIFNNISVKFEYHANLGGESSYNRSDKIIKWKNNNDALHGQIIHELFHAYAAQACGNKFKAYDVNNEIQARILQYAYCRANSLKLQETPAFIDKFINYYKSNSLTEYKELVKILKESDSYNVLTEYTATNNNIEEVQSLLKKCEKYNSL